MSRKPYSKVKRLPHYKRIHSIWLNMKARCTNPNRPKYPRYGGRGIKVCDEWNKDFLCFYNWSISHGYSPELQLDREDNDGNYCPENCRWVTLRENTKNRRTSKFLTVRGVTLNASVWAEKLNVSPYTIYWWCREKGNEYAEKRLEELLEGGV